MTTLERSCARCIRGVPRYPHRLCAACRKAGWRWCHACQQSVHVSDWYVSRSQCTSCKRQTDRDAREKQRHGQVSSPPAGFVTLTEAAPRLGYSTRYLRLLCKAERLTTWRRGDCGTWYVEVTQ